MNIPTTSPPPKTDSVVPDSLLTTAIETTAPRLRAFLVGIPLLLAVCLLSVYADMVSKVIQFGVLQFAPPAIAFLLALAGANRLLTHFLKREWLSKADLMAVYAMLLTGVLVSTRGVVEKLVPPLAYLPYFATRENRLNETITQYLPKWAVPFVPSSQAGPPSDVISAFWNGLTPGQPVPWSAWVGPLCAWFALIGAVIWVFLCMSVLLRRQWMDNEQLTFPLTSLPLAVIKDEIEGQPFWTNRGMWCGFAFAFLVFAVNGLNANFPDWPKFTLDMNWGGLLFTERPWNQLDFTPMYFSLAAVGFVYFLPTELLFSLWFFFWFARVQDLVAVQLGGMPTGIGTHNARVFTGYEAAGAYLVLVFAQLRVGLPYYRSAWKTAFSKNKPLDDSGEIFSYRTAFLGLFAGFGLIILWLSAAGMNPILAAAQMGIYLFFIALIMARGVAEGGLLMTETSFLPSHLIRLVYPLASFGPQSLTLMGTTDIIFTRDLRGVLLSSFLDNQKIAKSLNVKPRSLLWPLGLSIVISMVASTAFFLWINYKYGGLALYNYPRGNAANIFNTTAALQTGSTGLADATGYGGLVFGIIVTTALTWARTQFSWFPLHPLGFALAPTWAMMVLWFPCLVAWTIKATTLRFGGVDTYRKIAPFMLGMIGGEFVSAVLWATMNITRNWSVPTFPWP